MEKDEDNKFEDYKDYILNSLEALILKKESVYDFIKIIKHL